ncbi:MAG: hypothetical protein JRJ21_05180 [Deltaproteobacteria bacterium]|nr:hypothetical protein [Deltaproteobacteria bacterium]
MKQNASRSMVREIMTEFARLTGLSPTGKVPPRRYLWTDAFALCNFLGLYSQTRDEKYKGFALRLVDQVHNILGRHRDDDPRTGWISGLDEQEGRMHPTKGGLRIGKEMNERGPADPFDEGLEWDRDGQYYHYLTKWMHALNRVTRATGDSTYNNRAIELAKTAHAGFTYVPSSGGQKRMYWKMSIDLSYQLVPSMGQHDPLDGFITYNQLQATAAKDSERSAWPDIKAEIADMAGICEGKSWATDDPLGIGGLLGDAFKVAQLIVHENFEQTDLLEALLDSSLLGLESYTKQNQLKLPADYRLAFRELGLSIGLKAVEKLQVWIEQKPGLFHKKHALDFKIESLMQYSPLSEMIEMFWLERTNREAASWMAHRDINVVMLATSLAPDGYLIL